MSVVVPRDVPSTFTVAPMTGNPSSAERTTPVTVFCLSEPWFPLSSVFSLFPFGVCAKVGMAVSARRKGVKANNHNFLIIYICIVNESVMPLAYG